MKDKIMLPWEKQKADIETNHKNNGYDVECTHSGQKRAYGDTVREFSVKSDRPQEEIAQYCNDHVYKCHLSYGEWLEDNRKKDSTMNDHFRNCFKFRKVRDGEYFYQVIQQSTH